MKKIVSLVALSVLYTYSAFAQAPGIQWQKSYGGAGANLTASDIATSIEQTSDGGYIIAGASNSTDGEVTGNHGQRDIWIVKIDHAGALQWEKSYGGSQDDEAYAIKQTSDGGYIFVGITASTDGDVVGNPQTQTPVGWVVKITSQGTIQWGKVLGVTYSGGSYSPSYLYTIEQTNDGGYITAGSHYPVGSNLDAFIAKLDASGTIQWTKNYGGSGDDEVHTIHQSTDGGYIVSAITSSHDGDITGFHGTFYNDFWVLKLDGAGTLQWEKCFGGTSDDLPSYSSVIQSSDGGYVLIGNTTSSDGDITSFHTGDASYDNDIWVVKLNATGTIEWEKALGGSADENGFAMRQLTDGGYVIAGSTSSTDGDVTYNHGSTDVWMIKLSSTGNVLWQKTYGGSEIDEPKSITLSSDGYYAITGESYSTDGDISGLSTGGYCVVKFGSNAAVPTTNKENNVSIYPNPTSRGIAIQSADRIDDLKVIDVTGRCIYHSQPLQKNTSVDIDNAGIYSIAITVGSRTSNTKIVVNK